MANISSIAADPLPTTNGGSGLNSLNAIAWTPNLQINSSSTGITYTTQSGYYFNLGQIVFINCLIVLSSKGASSGNVSISNLPVATGPNGVTNFLPGAFANITLTTNYTDIDISFNNSTAVVTLQQFGSGQASTALTNTQLSNTSRIQFAGIYLLT